MARTVEFTRHAPKENIEHVTGMEAGLKSSKEHVIAEFVGKFIQQYPSKTIEIVTTPVDRAIETGDLFHDNLKSLGTDVMDPRINEYAGSYSFDSSNGKPINLSPRSMSKLWGKAKEGESEEPENKALTVWFDQGLDNPQAWNLNSSDSDRNTKDAGISLREIALRIGYYLDTKLDQETDVVLIPFSHSGDIETWLALTVLMNEGKDNGIEPMVNYDLTNVLKRIGGALKPLESVKIHHLSDSNKVNISGEFLNDYPNHELVIERSLIERQSSIFKQYGVSEEVKKWKIKNT